METLHKFKKINAVFKYKPEDFIVEEISKRYGRLGFNNKYEFKGGKGEHLVCIFIKRDVETFKMIKTISSFLHVSSERISLAGVKDKRSLTLQLGSIYKIKKERVERINNYFDNFRIIPLEYSEKKVYLGELEGNHFIITLRNVSKEDINLFKKNLVEFKENRNCYFPNYYGIQRFGENNRSDILGKLLLQRKYNEFIRQYLGNGKTTGFHERRVREYLEMHNNKDIIGGIRTLPRSLLKMFINAYQSRLFNEVLEFLLETKSFDELKNTTITLPGHDTQEFVLKDEITSFLEHKLRKDKISYENFNIKELNIVCKGTTRKALEQVKNLSYRIHEDEIFKGKLKIILEFDLDKGVYATSFLNEFFNFIKHF